MKLKFTLSFATAFLLLARAAMAADHEAGVPLTPAEAAGAWTVETGGHAICIIQLTADHGATPAQNCADSLPAGVTGWTATADGMALTGCARGVVLTSLFNRVEQQLCSSRTVRVGSTSS